MCGDILTRLKDFMAAEAIETMAVEVEDGRAGISGRVATLPEESEETERYLLVIGEMLSHQGEIIAQYREDMRRLENGEIEDPKVLERAEELRRFLLALSKISVLMRFSSVFGRWTEDAGRLMKAKDIREIILATLSGEDRESALEFALSMKKLVEEGVLTVEERMELERALDSYRAMA